MKSLDALVEATDALRAAVLTSRFPDEEVEALQLTSVPDVRTSVLTWAAKIEEAHHAVVALFDEPEMVVQHHTTTGGGAEIVHGMGTPTWSVSALLGGLPEHLRNSGASYLKDSLRDSGLLLPEEGLREYDESNTNIVRQVIRDGHLLISSRCMALVTWSTRAVAEFAEATFPSITSEGRPSAIVIRQCGAEREQPLTGTELDFLRNLSQHGEAQTYRKTKLNLVRKIPELGTFIEKAGRSPDDPANRAFYSLPPRIAKRIRIDPDK